MQDRVATYPNRWKLTPVAGETDVYDLERADEPVVAGTPLDKATFLTDTTAAAIAALTGNTPTLPTEALDELAGVLNDMTGLSRLEMGTYVGTGAKGAANAITLNFSITPSLVIVHARRAISHTLIALYGDNYSMPVTSDTTYVSWGATSITYYSDDSAGAQMNLSGITYSYIAIGEPE